MGFSILNKRSKCVCLIFLTTIAGGISYNFPIDIYDFIPQEMVHNYKPHHCKASEDVGCKG